MRRVVVDMQNALFSTPLQRLCKNLIQTLRYVKVKALPKPRICVLLRGRISLSWRLQPTRREGWRNA